jgi:MOSC domain-containing protein YiiM
METLKARLVSVCAGSGDGLAKEEQASITVELDGIVGDRHRGFHRRTWSGDKQPEGTRRRNERQWSAVSAEELAEITAAMDLAEPLTAASVGANLCLEGIGQLSRLPKGSILTFPSGAALIVEEYNPPCHDMGRKLAEEYRTRNGSAPDSTAFSRAATLKRGIVGVVEVPGTLSAGDEVAVEVYDTPAWLRRDGS